MTTSIDGTNRSLGWKTFFEALWPRFAEKILVVMATIEKHKSLLDREVTLGDINDARTARTRALEEYERNEVNRQRQNFDACKLSLAPRLYDQEMERMKNECCKDTCAWLSTDEDFKTWFDSRKRSSAFLWLSGIPGAGQYERHFILPLVLQVLFFILCFTFTFNRSFQSSNYRFRSRKYVSSTGFEPHFLFPFESLSLCTYIYGMMDSTQNLQENLTFLPISCRECGAKNETYSLCSLAFNIESRQIGLQSYIL